MKYASTVVTVQYEYPTYGYMFLEFPSVRCHQNHPKMWFEAFTVNHILVSVRRAGNVSCTITENGMIYIIEDQFLVKKIALWYLIWCSKLAMEDRSCSLVHWSRWQLVIENTTPVSEKS